MELLKSGLFAAGCAGLAALIGTAQAGHEVSYYPSFYPQEIRIEPLDAGAAAREFQNRTDPLHAYIGADPDFAGDAPPQLKSVFSLGALITLTLNPSSPRAGAPEGRCRAASEAARQLKKRPDIVAHRYPVTPFHGDYLHHIDLVPPEPARAQREQPLTFRKNAASAALLAEGAPTGENWDVELGERSVADLLGGAAAGASLWLPPPWAKEGWFQAYQFLRPAIADAARAERVDAIYERLTLSSAGEARERADLERQLVRALSEGCERAIIGYRLVREFYNDDFSNGIENIASDQQFGFNAPVVPRTMKLKDFPWNGWLRLGIAGGGSAAWNPLAGFHDGLGRLVWSTVADAAFLPVPYSNHWVDNRTELLPPDAAQPVSQSTLVPAGAVRPEPATGRLTALAAGQGAAGKVAYRVLASAFQDGSELEPADLFYPYALAFKWGERGGDPKAFDPEIAAASKLLRERLAGVRVVRVESRALALADLTFIYKSPIVEVYLNALSRDAEADGLIAPPWSSVPWHVLALMEAAVERNLAAFSEAEAARRGVAWLDMVRDTALLAKLTELIKEFAQSGYRPAALEGLVSASAASARWSALAKFVAEHGHLLVTNGPYRLVSWSPTAVVLGVVRDFNYPVGLGTFDRFAYPPHALITAVERAASGIVLSADVEMAVKQQRDHRLQRLPLKRETLRGTLVIRPVARYLVVGDRGRVVAAGAASWREDGRFVIDAPPAPSPGPNRLFAGIFLDGNTLDPSIGSIELEQK